MGEEEYFTRLILRGTGAITVAINDNVETFYRDFSTLSRLTAHGKYREPRIRAALSGSVRQFRTILIPARRGGARKFPRPRNGFARCVYLREYIYIYIYIYIYDISIGHAIDVAISRMVELFHQTVQMIISSNEDKEVISWWMDESHI